MKRLVGAIVLLAVAAPASAQAPGLTLRADKERPGRIGLTVEGPAGATVTLEETTREDREVGEVVLDAAGQATLPDAATWRCSPRLRTFEALADGTTLTARARVRTPSCARRYRVKATPRRPRSGGTVTVRLTDRFRLDDAEARACIGRSCAPIRRGTAKLRVRGTGRTRVVVTVGGQRLATALEVRRAKHLTLLATGDSMIQVIDGFLRDRLRARNVGVRSDARISSGLSKPFFFNWPRHAKRQAAKRPDVVVMFIGANDGFPFGEAQCCGKAWRRVYARRVGAMMDTYARGGAAEVYWCLLPAPREGRFRRVFAAVNVASRRAARRHDGHVVDLAKVFTPGFRFRRTFPGRSTDVRQEDGVHLNAAGASIAANLIIRKLRRDGVL